MNKYCMIVLSVCLLALTSVTFAEDTAETKDIRLPEHPKSVNVDLATALEQRKSTRQYASTELFIENLAAILWAANGVNRPDGKRTAPSAYGKQYIEIYVATENGFYQYDAPQHQLKFKGKADIRKKLSGQQHVQQASHVLVLVADMEKVPGYFIDQDIKLNWANATAGAIAENVYLMAAAKQIGTCLVAGIEGKEVQKILKLSERKVPLYVMPLGYIR